MYDEESCISFSSKSHTIRPANGRLFEFWAGWKSTATKTSNAHRWSVSDPCTVARMLGWENMIKVPTCLLIALSACVIGFEHATGAPVSPAAIKSVQMHHSIVCRPLPADKEAVVSGWGVSGSTAVGPVFPNKLQKMPMTLLSDDVCLDSLIFFSFSPGPMTCAEPAAGGSLCWGDSGGALTYYRSTGRPVLAAVTSWGVDCDLDQRPTVFIDIGFFVNWIGDVIE